MGSGAPTTFEFDVYRLDLAAGRLWRGDEPVALRPKTWSVLCHLVRSAGQLVPADELLDATWPNTAVTPQTLTNVIVELRRVFGDPRFNPRFIETVPRRGFRFVAPVRCTAGAGPRPGAPHVPVPPELFVGREQEARQLEAAWQGALAGRPSVLFVSGEPGIGKTTLLRWFLHAAHRGEGPPCLVASTACLERNGPSESYLPVLDLLAKLVEQDAPSVGERMARSAPDWHAQLRWLMPSTGLPDRPEARPAIGDGRLLLELLPFLEALSERTPLLLVIDDLQWADGPTLDVFATFARRMSPARLMLVGGFAPAHATEGPRPVEDMADRLCARGKAKCISLRRFDAAKITAYLARRLGDPEIASRLAPFVESGSHGNPLLAEAIVGELLERGWIVGGDGRVSLGPDFDPSALAIPERLHRSTERDFASLDAATMAMLEAASVIGLEFPLDLLAAALGSNAEEVERICRELARRGLLLHRTGSIQWPDGAGRHRYAFTHALHRGVLYDRLPAARRAALHHAVGERLERAFAQTPREAAAELARHFERGGNAPRAERYRSLAGI